ncbi:MAG: metal/formaldehyde-sensitive transcriptional repressor [Candidatus Eremiobacterota bacterium]
MSHVIQNKKKLLQRARRVQGQVAALVTALEEERDCGSVLQQIAACRGAIHGLMTEVLEGHVSCHLTLDDPDERRKSADEILQLVRTYMR